MNSQNSTATPIQVVEDPQIYDRPTDLPPQVQKTASPERREMIPMIVGNTPVNYINIFGILIQAFSIQLAEEAYDHPYTIPNFFVRQLGNSRVPGLNQDLTTPMELEQDPPLQETEVYQELKVQQVPEEPCIYDRPNDLPPTVSETHSTVQKPIIILSPGSIENRNLLISSISIGTTPADYKSIFETLMQDPPTQEDQSYDRPNDLPPHSQQSFQEPICGSSMTPDSLRVRAVLLSRQPITGSTSVEFERIFENIKNI